MSLEIARPLLQNVKHPGVPVRLNGRNYYIPSLSVKDYRAHEAAITASQTGEGPLSESFDKFIPIIGAAIRRNYPDVTDENLEDWLDLRSYKLAIKAFSDASDLEAVTQGE